MAEALLETHLSLILLARGKVRDVYVRDARDPESDLIFIATDRISAFDHVLGSGIPDKGRILTQLSLFWFEFLKDIVHNHLVTADVDDMPATAQNAHTGWGNLFAPALCHLAPGTLTSPSKNGLLAGRTMLVRRAQMFPVECVVRGYLSGSGWKDYQATGSVCGIALPRGLHESDKLPEPIFTPAAKINTGGHDENISFARMVDVLGAEDAEALRTLSFAIYEKARAHAATKDVILADTKFEFGRIDGRITLCDEVLTPDSSRYWPASEYAPGGAVPSFDKQFCARLPGIHSLEQTRARPLPARRSRQKDTRQVHAGLHPAERTRGALAMGPALASLTSPASFTNLTSFTSFDWFLVILVAGSTLAAFFRGIIKVLFSLLGLIVGTVLAGWNYLALANRLRTSGSSTFRLPKQSRSCSSSSP